MKLLAPVLLVLVAYFLSYYGVDYLINKEHQRLENFCLERISQGIIYSECRQYWNLCPLYFTDCGTDEYYEWDCKPNGTCISRRVP